MDEHRAALAAVLGCLGSESSRHHHFTEQKKSSSVKLSLPLPDPGSSRHPPFVTVTHHPLPLLSQDILFVFE